MLNVDSAHCTLDDAYPELTITLQLTPGVYVAAKVAVTFGCAAVVIATVDDVSRTYNGDGGVVVFTAAEKPVEVTDPSDVKCRYMYGPDDT